MLYEVVYWQDDGAEERPPLDELLARPELRRYVENWGRIGDGAIVALDRLNEPVGAVWYRQFSAAEPGFGFVAPDVPELAMAVYPECRGQRVGSLLLGTLVSRARAGGSASISVSIAAENPARRLFARQGFEIVPREDITIAGGSGPRSANGEEWLTMLLELD
jgi:GNAT superfamily N-acetyltransferase